MDVDLRSVQRTDGLLCLLIVIMIKCNDKKIIKWKKILKIIIHLKILRIM